MTLREFALPDLGEGLTEAQIIRWLVAVGDRVTVDQPVVEVETAKAAVEVPIPFAGVVTALSAAAGDIVDVGATLVAIGEAAPDEGVLGAEAARYVEEERAGSGNVLVGYGTTETKRRRRNRRTTPAPAPAPVLAATSVPERGSASARTRASAMDADTAPYARPKASSPVVRRLARDNGVDLAALTGSGPDGLITRADVQQAISPVPAAQPQVSAAAKDQEHEVLPVRARIPLQGTRRAAAEAFTRSRREIPDATTWVDVDATALIELRRNLNARNPDAPVGLLALFARFVTAGLALHPELNSRVDLAAGEIVQFDGVNLGIAAQTARGLMVPVIKNAHTLTARGLQTELTRLTEASDAGTLTVADLTSGTFTLNNYGVFGVDGSAPIINHPQAAILGIGRIIDRPWAVEGELRLRKVGQLSLAFDHRVCDGAPAAAFLRFVADCIERPHEALADL